MGEVGDALRERRMALKIDVHEVEEATKIRAKYLRALENEEYDLLPGNAYVKSFLRTYAEYLDLDARAIVDSYRSRTGTHEEEPAGLVGRNNSQSSPRRVWWIVALALIVIVALFLLIGMLTGGSA